MFTKIVTQPARRRPWPLGLMLAAVVLAACNPLNAVQPAQPTASPSAAVTSPAESPRAGASPATTAAPTSDAPATATAVPGDQPVAISGAFEYTNDILNTYYVEHAVALVDMYGFVTRDREWELPVTGQTLGFLEIDEEQQRGEFRLQLPAQPQGTPVNLGSTTGDDNVQVFAVAYWPNLAGGPFSEGDDRSRGWPSYLASTVNDSNRQDEVIGGALVVWATDGEQQFPSGWGDDGLLFTDDDPVQPIAAGWSVINLDSEPFAVVRGAEPEVTLHEPQDLALKDFSDLSYTAAFERMFEQVRREYAFNGVEGKQPNYDALYAEIQPRVAEAERRSDPKAFYEALLDFTLGFRDGHVGVSGGGDVGIEVFQGRAGGGYGFAMRELDDGRFIVVDIMPDGPAAQAGMTVGAEVTAFNNQPMDEAASAVVPVEGPFSTDFALRYQQVAYLVRAPLGTTATVTFRNAGATPQTATLEAVPEFQSYLATYPFRDFDPNALPVEFSIRESGVGYVRVTSNYDDLNLIVRLFERALQTFEQNGLEAVIIDMRLNAGGASLGLAGFLTDETITMGQLEYFSDATGQFEPEGLPEEVLPNENQYRFDRLALLVDQSCYSACEIEAYAFSQVPGMEVWGQYPTAGVEAEVARGQFQLPEGISLQVPTGRFVLPDGSIFLEGQGVQPTQRVPITEETVLAEGDVVLETAEQALLSR